MADYLPQSDADLDAWATNFENVLLAAPTTYGETTVTASAFDSVYGSWHDAYGNHLAKQAEALSFAASKDTARQNLIDAIRTMARRMQIASTMTDAKRALLGITVRDAIHTPVGAPSSKPVLAIDTSDSLRHTINFADEGTPTSRGKPDGVYGIEIWHKIGGTSPATPADCEYLATDTRTPYLAVYETGQAGQTVYYIARWLSTNQEPGPWCTVQQATVPAL